MDALEVYRETSPGFPEPLPASTYNRLTTEHSKLHIFKKWMLIIYMTLDSKLRQPNCPMVCYMDTVEDITRIPRILQVTVLCILFMSYMVFAKTAHLACCCFGTWYPLYLTFTTSIPKEKDDDAKLMCYWAVYGFLALVDYFHASTPSVYWLMKFIFLLWCLVPGPGNGMDVLFDLLILKDISLALESIKSRF